MKTLHALTAAAGILLVLATPTLAAQRVHRAYDAYASGTTDRSGAYYYGPRDAQGRAIVAPFESVSQSSRGANLPFADRPYGDPDNW